jgi:predicted PurR-regulated permease PerM
MSDPAPRVRLSQMYRYGFVAALGVLTALALAGVLYAARQVVMMFAVAGLLAYLLAGPIDWLTARFGRRKLFTGVVFAAFVLLMLGLFSSFIPVVAVQTRDLVQNFPDYVAQIEQRFNEIGARFNMSEEVRLSDYLHHLQSQLQGNSPDVMSKILGYGKTVLSGTAIALSWMVLIPLMALYLLLDSDKLRRQLMGLFSERHQPSVDQALTLVNKTLGSYIYSRVVLALMIWIAYTILLLAFGIPYFYLLGILAFIGEFIPVVGGLIAFTPIALVVLATASDKFIWIVLIIVVLQAFQSYVTAPKIMSESMDIHPLTVVIAMLVGGALGGGLGLLLAVPVAAAVKAIYTVFTRHREDLLGVNMSVVDLVRRSTDKDPKNDPAV